MIVTELHRRCRLIIDKYYAKTVLFKVYSSSIHRRLGTSSHLIYFCSVHFFSLRGVCMWSGSFTFQKTIPFLPLTLCPFFPLIWLAFPFSLLFPFLLGLFLSLLCSDWSTYRPGGPEPHVDRELSSKLDPGLRNSGGLERWVTEVVGWIAKGVEYGGSEWRGCRSESFLSDGIETARMACVTIGIVKVIHVSYQLCKYILYSFWLFVFLSFLANNDLINYMFMILPA